ncbi:platelet-derived growth factor D isoform X2 [Betta splendens]|uniref:Platelet-derived growth factor D n=1 Tax=Betta splendens TaxID=158456 RepID=A0A6P7PCQ9_BETSP|nr:platelet-derived growth factor D isoform X2 [Betta splendens]
MRGAAVSHVWMLLMLEAVAGVGGDQEPTAKVMRGTRRRDDLYCKEENVTVTAAGGVIHSPRFPNAYPRNLLLSWRLLSLPGSRIHLEFDGHFGLEEAENGACRYDFVEVEDQSESSTVIWGRWCGQKAPPSLNSKSNKLRVTFKSDDYFVAKPGFKVYYSLLYDTPQPASNTNWEAVTVPMSMPVTITEAAVSLDDLDRTIADFETVEQLLKSLNPNTWKQDLNSIYTQTHIHYKSRAYHLASRHNKVDLNRLHDDVKRYSCTPRNHTVNLREELRATNALFFPRCLLVKRCGGDCGCGTSDWNSGCSCRASKTAAKLHEVLKYTPEVTLHQHQRRLQMSWAMDEIFLTHHETCECVCPSQPPR